MLPLYNFLSLLTYFFLFFFFFSSRRRHTRFKCDWSSDVCSSDLVEPVGGQRGDDPVHRPAQHMLLIRQPRQEPGGEQALRHRPGRRRRAGRPGPRMRAPPPVAAPPPHDPGDLHLPVDLLAVLGAQELERLPALGAAPLAGLHIDDPFLGLQMRTIPPPVTRPARPLPALTRAAGPAGPLPAVPP